MSRVGTANVQIITGENTSNSEPVRGVAKDLDPKSPTYVNGPFGAVVEEEQRQGVTSTAMAQDAAVGKLRTSRNAIEEVDFEALPNSALEPGDIVDVSKARLRLVDRPLILQTGTIPLRGKSLMQMTALANPNVQVSEL